MGFKDMMARAKEEAEVSQRLNQLAKERAKSMPPSPKVSFEGIEMKNGRLKHEKTSGPVQGATARVETGADARRRMTATRTIMLGGIGGVLFKKQAGHVYLTIEHADYEIAVEVPAKKESDARKFATKVNNAARK